MKDTTSIIIDLKARRDVLKVELASIEQAIYTLESAQNPSPTQQGFTLQTVKGLNSLAEINNLNTSQMNLLSAMPTHKRQSTPRPGSLVHMTADVIEKVIMKNMRPMKTEELYELVKSDSRLQLHGTEFSSPQSILSARISNSKRFESSRKGWVPKKAAMLF